MIVLNILEIPFSSANVNTAPLKNKPLYYLLDKREDNFNVTFINTIFFVKLAFIKKCQANKFENQSFGLRITVSALKLIFNFQK